MMIAEQLRKSVLQAAIQGKLTEQLPSDGDARDLLAQIKKERQKLAKEGKIKKEKAPEPITEDEMPFEIPKNWIWCRIGYVTYNLGQKIPNEDFSYIDVGSIDNGHYTLSKSDNVVKCEKAPSRARKIVSYGNVIYSTVRPYLHNICVIDRCFIKESIASTAFVVMQPYSILNNYFLFYWLLSPAFDRYANGDNSKGVTYPAIRESQFLNGVIPLPPLAEQKRIVERLDELLPLCDELDEDE